MSAPVRFIKHNRTRMKADMEEEGRRVLFDFFARLEGKVKGMKGYTILEKIGDKQELAIMTLWETKEDMDSFYAPGNMALDELLAKSKGMLEQPPERNDYKVIRMKM